MASSTQQPSPSDGAAAAGTCAAAAASSAAVAASAALRALISAKSLRGRAWVRACARGCTRARAWIGGRADIKRHHKAVGRPLHEALAADSSAPADL
jgi:hypothetical protein